MKLLKYIFLSIIITNYALGAVSEQDFIDLAKKTRSIFSGQASIDASNALNSSFETLLTNQKVYLQISASKLNSSVYTLINSDSSSLTGKSTLITPPVINVYDLNIKIDPSVSMPSQCDGSGIVGADTDCTGKNCTITQRVVSQCNADDCWESSPTTDRSLTALVSEPFKMSSEVEITSCIPNNIAGQKHELEMTVANESSNLLRGGSVQYSLILQNDVSI